MTLDKGFHLNEDQMIKVVVDKGELSRELSNHLADCPQCLAEKKSFEQDLTQIGHMAIQYSPLNIKKINYPISAPERSWKLSWNLCFAVGVVATAVFALFILLEMPWKQDAPLPMFESFPLEMVDEKYVNESLFFVEDALPLTYKDISADIEYLIDDDFIRFVVPEVEDSPFTMKNLQKKGEILC